MESDLQEFVRIANQSLLESGKLPAGWIEQYEGRIDSIAAEYDGATWPKDVFASIHFVATHLCLRFNARASQVNADREDTRRDLAHLHRISDLFLWQSVSCLPRPEEVPGLSETERELVSLSLGSNSPVVQSDVGPEILTWESRFKDRLTGLSRHSSRHETWNKWLCVSLHFASFYFDLWLQQDVDLTKPPEMPLGDQAIRQILGSLESRIVNDRVRNLIAIWLTSANVDRNAAGLPRVTGSRGPRQIASVRTSTEIFILSELP